MERDGDIERQAAWPAAVWVDSRSRLSLLTSPEICRLDNDDSGTRILTKVTVSLRRDEPCTMHVVRQTRPKSVHRIVAVGAANRTEDFTSAGRMQGLVSAERDGDLERQAAWPAAVWVDSRSRLSLLASPEICRLDNDDSGTRILTKVTVSLRRDEPCTVHVVRQTRPKSVHRMVAVGAANRSEDFTSTGRMQGLVSAERDGDITGIRHFADALAVAGLKNFIHSRL